MRQKLVSIFLFLLTISVCFETHADGSTIDKVYHPYVQILEKEIEYRALYEQDGDEAVDGRSRHRLGYGQALSDRFFVELYLTGVEEPGGDPNLESYEAEVKWQLTEQGKYDNDWGSCLSWKKYTMRIYGKRVQR